VTSEGSVQGIAALKHGASFEKRAARCECNVGVWVLGVESARGHVQPVRRSQLACRGNHRGSSLLGSCGVTQTRGIHGDGCGCLAVGGAPMCVSCTSLKEERRRSTQQHGSLVLW